MNANKRKCFLFSRISLMISEFSVKKLLCGKFQLIKMKLFNSDSILYSSINVT
jgi:hypothetical protein